ncbi:MAG: hypothetical protein ACKOWD_01475 [Rhodoferax sp.]
MNKNSSIESAHQAASMAASEPHSKISETSAAQGHKDFKKLVHEEDLNACSNAKKGHREIQVVVTAPEQSNSLSAFGPSLISAILVVAGWFVVNKAQANRERRKQIREFASGLIKDLSEIERAAIQYHVEKRDKKEESLILTRLTRLEKACGIFPEFLNSQRVIKAVKIERLHVDSNLLRQMHKAITLEHFLDEHTQPIDIDSVQIQKIGLAVSDVQDAIEAVRLASLD